MEKKEQLYEGKAKKVFATDDANLVIVDYKDDATAFNGEKKGTITGKGVINNVMSNHMFQLLEQQGVTHLLASRTAAFASTRLDDIACSSADVDTVPSVLFVCVQNAGRSQLAAGILRQLAGDRVIVRTAGSAPAAEVRPTIVTALDEIGGFAVETVTEDAHTAIRLHRAGYRSAYIPVPQAAGLATESLSAHVGQRIRWARGMAQICRVDNPLFGPGLKLGQRLCYFNAMLHFFYGLPRLVFLTAPLAYLFFSAHVFQATAAMITAYALPHLMHASITNSRIQGRFRYSFWNEVYESVLAWYIMRPVLVAFVNPKLGKFNVTAKGGVIEQSYFDWSIARPYLILLLLNLLGFAVGIWRMVAVGPSSEVFTTLVINMVWTAYNIILTSASLAVASEKRQVRSTPRVTAALPAALRFADGKTLVCETDDFSQSGVGLRVPNELQLETGSEVHVSLFRTDEEGTFPAQVTFSGGGRLGLRFEGLSLRQQADIARLTFARADAWIDFWGNRQHDKPLTSLKSVMVIGVRGLGQVAANTLNILRGRREVVSK